ncbi:MAG: hypothetical protein AAFN81_33610 [Bacteroidota bacterium]
MKSWIRATVAALLRDSPAMEGARMAVLSCEASWKTIAKWAAQNTYRTALGARSFSNNPFFFPTEPPNWRRET